jgi:PAS domain S-box-containing protein
MTPGLAFPPRDQTDAEQIAELLARLREAEETLEAIRTGQVDAVIVSGAAGAQIYTLESADRPYRLLVEQMQEGALTLSVDGRILYCNRRFADLIGRPPEALFGATLSHFIAEIDHIRLSQLIEEAVTRETRDEIVMIGVGGEFPVQMALAHFTGDSGVIICVVVSDLTEYNRHSNELAEANQKLRDQIADRQRAEDQLRQAQKMEAVGQLTGGLAHDFNNILAGISGSLEMIEARIAQGRTEDLGRYVGAAKNLSKRAAALTHRLLAFSRRQTLDPKATDVNRLVAGMLEFIQRTVGPQISVEAAAAVGLWNTLVDAGQLENALLNLCINAHDAMPHGGKLTIETANKWLDESAAGQRDLPPGQYVSLCVSDTGIGMTPEVVARAFDPFFTTKPIGAGTGLGLSMVYGFARQSEGQVRIYSEIDKGTMVCVYLPRHLGAAAAEDAAVLTAAPRAGESETVLVVDDEPVVRMLIVEALEELGYLALEAIDGSSALKILNSNVAISLLVSDVGLPGGMNGRQLADAARVGRPDLKILFITGCAENAVLNHGHLEPDMHVLTKPFSMDVLARRMRELLEPKKGGRAQTPRLDPGAAALRNAAALRPTVRAPGGMDHAAWGC